MSRNILNSSGVYLNTVSGGDAINVASSNSSASTISVDISKQTAKTTILDSDLFLLEESDGSVKKITGANLKSVIDTNFFTLNSPNIYPKLTSENLLVGTTSNSDTRKLLVNGTSEFQGIIYSKGASGVAGYINLYDIDKSHHTSLFPTENVNANVVLPASSGTLCLTTGSSSIATVGTITTGIWNGDRLGKSYVPIDTVYDADLTTAENFGTALSRTDPDTLNFGTGGNDSGVGTTTNIDGYNINIGELVATGGGNSGSVGANEITIQATQYYSGNPRIHITAQSASGVVNTGAEVNITSKKNGSGSDVANITMVADTEIIMNTGFKINSSGVITTGTWNGDRLGKSYIPTDTVYDADIASFITASSTDTLTNKTIGDFTTFNEGLGIKFNSFSGVSGYVRFYDKDATNFIDLHPESHSLTSNVTVFLPKSTDNTILVGKDTTDTLTNKTLTGGSNSIISFSGDSGSVITTPSIDGTLAVVSQIPAEHSYNTPLTLSSGSVSLGNLNGYGTSNQVLITNGSDAISYKTLTAGTNIGIGHSSNAITISSSDNYWENANTIGVLDIQPVSTVNDIDLDAINLLVLPKTVNVIPTGLSSGKVIQYDSGLGGGNGSMVFGDNGTSASTNWDTGIYAKQFINLKCGDTSLLRLNNTPAGVKTATFDLNNISISLDSNNSYNNISYGDCEPLLLYNKASTGTTHSHLVLKHDSSQSDYIVLRQNESGYFYIHFENEGDRFEVSKYWEYGNAYAKWYYDGSDYTYFRNPSGTNSGNSFAGAYFTFHNNGSAIYMNCPGAGTSAGDYIGFATGGVPKGRMEMTGNLKITGSLTESHSFCDERVKENIQDYNVNATELLNKLQIKSFNRKTFDNLQADENGILLPFAQRFSDKSYYDIGLIAQEVLKIPELEFLVENQDGGDIEPMTIPDWNPLTAICIKAIQEQQKQIKSQDDKIDHLTKLVFEMKGQLDKMK